MNDAIQCYDRIIHAIVSICLRRAKVAWNFIVCLLLVLQLARHSILTGFGLSEVTYGGILELLILMGVMQGNGARPLFWLLISSVLVECMKSRDFQPVFTSTITKTTISVVGFLWVDDADGLHCEIHSRQSG